MYSEPSVLESTNIGQGFEFGLPYTYTGPGSYQYHVEYLGTGTYTAFVLGQ
ncbi:hypothetical protein IKS57_06180 [bacterium]|nr:hypothetical protein [bacterium]